MSRYLILVPVDKFLSSITPRAVYCFYLAYYGMIYPGISISPVFAPVIIIILPNFLSFNYSVVDLRPFFGRHIRYFGLSLSVHSDVFRLVRFVPGFHILFMAEINATMLLCPVQGCGFIYSEEDRNAIRTHKARVHTSSVKVIYQNPLIEVVLNRTEDSFHCVRCDHSTQYPNAIQVRIF